MSDTVSRYEIPKDNECSLLREGVLRALRAVPLHFNSSINIEGLSATELFALNTLLGGAIEQQTVATLNAARSIWDPEGRWVDYEFRRYPESFPDVRLENDDCNTPLIGIELKGWYLLAKEEEPSFRFRASADAMTVWDLLVVYPWSLSNVLSGKPILHSPFIEQAKYVADLRTRYWETRSKNAKPVIHPKTHPYPEPGSSYSDTVSDDSGGNFGRIARIKGLMDEWNCEAMKTPLAGIEAEWWVKFLKLFDERSDPKTIQSRFETLAKKAGKTTEWGDKILFHLQEIYKLGF